jgi:peptidyl-tRNA hydrolase
MHVEQLIALWVTICQRQRVGIKSRDQMELTTKYVNHHLTEQQRQQLAEVLERWAGEKYRKAYKDITPTIIAQCFALQEKEQAK